MDDVVRVNRLARGRNLTWSLADHVGREIVTGRYDDRAFPTEGQLAEQHRVSRSVTREAMKMLSAKGLVSARPRQGTAVQPRHAWNLFDPDVLSWLLERRFEPGLLRQFNQLRLGIEPEAAALAAAHASGADRAAIARGLMRMRVAEAGADDTLEADIAFHVAVLDAARNPFYAQFKPMVAAALKTSITFTNRIAGHSASIADHAAVADAIGRGDEGGARAAMRRLIDDVLTLIDREAAAPVRP